MAVPDQVRYEIRSTSGRAFEHLCHDLLHWFYPGLLEVRAMGLIDKLGVDLCTMNDEGVLIDAFQCKGFEHEFGASQLAQCTESIDTFLRKAVRVASYKLIINRSIVDPEMRSSLERAVNAIQASGLAKSVEVLWLDKFCSVLEELGKAWCKQAIFRRFEALRATYAEAMDWLFYVANVPAHSDNGASLAGDRSHF